MVQQDDDDAGNHHAGVDKSLTAHDHVLSTQSIPRWMHICVVVPLLLQTDIQSLMYQHHETVSKEVVTDPRVNKSFGKR